MIANVTINTELGTQRETYCLVGAIMIDLFQAQTVSDDPVKTQRVKLDHIIVRYLVSAPMVISLSVIRSVLRLESLSCTPTRRGTHTPSLAVYLRTLI